MAEQIIRPRNFTDTATDSDLQNADNFLWLDTANKAKKVEITRLAVVGNNAATESDLVAGSKLPIMTANGPKSLPGNTIAKASEQAAIATYAQNVAHSIAPEFDPTRTSENPYKAGESVIYTDGKVYTFTDLHYGPWTGTDVRETNSGDQIEDAKDMAEASNVSLEHSATANGYYTNEGEFISHAFVKSYRFAVTGSSTYNVMASMYGAMAVCEFDSNDNFIAYHKKATGSVTEHYNSLVFQVKPNTAYIWVGNDTTHRLLPQVEELYGLDCSYDLSKVNTAYNCPWSAEYDGYYNNSGTFVSDSNYKALKVKVTPSTRYTYVGNKTGSIAIIEYNKFDIKIATYYESGTFSRQEFKTTEQADYVIISSKVSADVPLPQLYVIDVDDSFWRDFIGPETYVVDATDYVKGIITGNGNFAVNDNFVTKKFPVKYGHKYRALAQLYSNLNVSEFDENDNFIINHYNKVSEPFGQYYYMLDFCVSPNCAYVKFSSRNIQGRSPRLWCLGWNEMPVPRKFYGSAGVQKNIYNDRFGLEKYGYVDLHCTGNAYTHFHNRLEFNATESGTFVLSAYGSVAGKYVYGNEFKTKHAGVSSVEFVTRVNPATAKNILWVGDSISDYANTAQYAKALFDEVQNGVAPTFVGTKHTTGTPDEAIAGSKISWFMTNSDSPFVFNGEVSFSSYNSQIGVSSIDLCVMALGFNDMTDIIDADYTLEQVVEFYEDFIEKITEANPSIKIVWVACILPSKLEKMRDSIDYTQTCMKLRHVANYLESKHSNVIVSDASYCIDSVNGYQLTQVPIASVYSSLNRTQDYCDDSTHPTALGCKEWATSIYAAMVKALS